MKFIAHVLGLQKNANRLKRRTFPQYQQQLLLRQGREQFKRLVDRGLNVPVAYL